MYNNLELKVNTVADFIDEENFHELQLANLLGWDFVSGQTKGAPFDFTAPDTSTIESKFDWDSKKTGNHYLEIAQTNDNKVTWVPSGFSVSSEVADFWIVINEDWMRLFQIQKLKEFLKENRSKLVTKETRCGVNFNVEGQYSMGYIIPFSVLDSVCLLKHPSSLVRTNK